MAVTLNGIMSEKIKKKAFSKKYIEKAFLP
jgi:hypothetical protein